MRLVCVSRYRSSLGSFTEGQDVDVNEDVAEFLLRDSPGSFRREGEPAPERVDVVDESALVEEPIPEEEPEPERDLSAMSTETETGIVAPDRRARGGRRRRN